MSNDLLAVAVALFLLSEAHLLTCPNCRQKTVAYLDTVVERIRYGRREP